MEKRKRNSETAGAAAQGGTPAGYRNLGDEAGCREHAAETRDKVRTGEAGCREHAAETGHRERGDKAETTPCTPAGSQDGTAEPQGRRMERGAVAPGSAWALVTGAGSGIGRCYALQLAALGYRLVIVGNNPAPLEAVAEEIRSTAAGRPSAGGKIHAAAQPDAGDMNAGDAAAEDTDTGNTAAGGTDTGNTAAEDTAAEDTAAGEGTLRRTAGSGGETTTGTPAGTAKNRTARPEVRVIPTDLARVGAAQELYDRIAAEGIGIDVVINNAGIFSFCDILTTPPERIERIVLLHDLTVSQLCRLYAADMVRRGVRGHILNMSSYSLWMPFPGLALYSASKAYMRSFSVAFAKEVREHGIRVTAVCPAGVATDLYGLTPRWQRIGKRLGVLITPDSCARRGLRALWRGRRCIVPDWWNRAWIPLCKVLPMWVLRPIRRFTMKFQK